MNIVPVRLAAISLLAVTAGAAQAQAAASTLADSMRAGGQAYVFVGAHMPHRSLVELAREAGLAGATLVLRGFDSPSGQPVDLVATQRLAAQINSECCGAAKQPQAHWIVDPKRYEQFDVKAVPTFVLVPSGGSGQARGDAGYVKVSGDMALASALKFITQTSRNKPARDQATRLYRQAFGGTQ